MKGAAPLFRRVIDAAASAELRPPLASSGRAVLSRCIGGSLDASGVAIPSGSACFPLPLPVSLGAGFGAGFAAGFSAALPAAFLPLSAAAGAAGSFSACFGPLRFIAGSGLPSCGGAAGPAWGDRLLLPLSRPLPVSAAGLASAVFSFFFPFFAGSGGDAAPLCGDGDRDRSVDSRLPRRFGLTCGGATCTRTTGLPGRPATRWPSRARAARAASGVEKEMYSFRRLCGPSSITSDASVTTSRAPKGPRRSCSDPCADRLDTTSVGAGTKRLSAAHMALTSAHCCSRTRRTSASSRYGTCVHGATG
mmetsp:Transcript_13260/g.41251  ORF Transcript_13260/g.41251 Transcript_13260/m.41251 type:complete len:306 (+) Transcript_13260:626-1543(+)